MAQIWLERSYIEPFDETEDDWSISIHIKTGKQEILAGKVEMDPRSWIYIDYNEDKDLIINNSPGMERNKWDHIIHETLGNINEPDE